MIRSFLIACLICAGNSLYSQKYLKTEYTTPAQQKEYERIDYMPNDSLWLGLEKNLALYKSSGKEVYLWLWNNYANQIIWYKLSFDPFLFEKTREIARYHKDTLTEEYASTYAEEAIFYFYHKQKEKSQDLNAKAYQLYKKVEMGNYLPMVNMAYKIAYIYQSMGEYKKSLHYAGRCLEDARLHDVPVLEAATYIILSKITQDYDPWLSAKFSQKGLQITYQKKGIFYKVRQRLYLHLTLLHANYLENYPKAIEYADSSCKHIKNKDRNMHYSLGVYRNKALSLYKIGEIEQANALAREMDSLVELPIIKTNPEYFYFLSHVLGFTYYYFDQYEKARYYHEKGMQAHEENGFKKDNIQFLIMNNHLLKTYLGLREFKLFDSLYSKNKVIYTRGLPEDSLINKLEYPPLAHLQEYIKYGIQRMAMEKTSREDMDSLLALYEVNYKITNALFTRADINSASIYKNIQFLVDCANAIFKSGCIHGMSEGQKQKFWLISSAIKSFDLINKKMLKVYNSANSAKYLQLMANLELHDENDSLYTKYLDEYIHYAINHHLPNVIRQDNPIDPGILKKNYQKTKSLMETPASSLVLDIYQSDSLLSFISIHDGALNYYSLPIDKKTRAGLDDLKRDVKNLSYQSNKGFLAIQEKMEQLLYNKEEITKIHVIADGELLVFPFELLVVNGKMLIEEFEISYNYSPFLLKESIENTRHTKTSILAIAPVFSGQNHEMVSTLRAEMQAFDENGLASGIYRDENQLSPLPHTREEVESIQEIFSKNHKDALLLLGNEATEGACREHIGKYDIIHFATHGFSSSRKPSLSRLILSSDTMGREEEENDAFLYLRETYGLSMNADLVVLSACKSGTGKIIKGEGIMALPRGFIYAGVPNVIASLWKVHDEKTRLFMETFYKHLLNDNATYSGALRLAKLDCIQKGFLPLDWAGFVLIGN